MKMDEKVFNVMGQRSRAGSDGNGNLVNLIALEPLKEFEQKLVQILTVVGSRTDEVSTVMGQRSRSQIRSPAEA